MTIGIYWFYQPSQDRAIYVGSSLKVEKRISYHKSALRRGKHYNFHLQATWNKYGHKDLEISLLEECTADNLIDREDYWMNLMPTWPSCNVGIAAWNGMAGRKHSDDVRKRMSNSRTGLKRVFTEEHKQNISLGKRGNKLGPLSEERRKNLASVWVGRKHTDDTKKKISLANRGKKRTEETRKEMSRSRRGRKMGPMSNEQKAVLSARHMGKKLSEEHKANIGKSLLGKKRSEETKTKMKEAWKIRKAKENDNG